MKVVIIGASGTLGRAVVDELSPRHEIVKVGRKVLESMDTYGDFFRGHEPVTAARVALAFSKSVEGLLNGKVFQVL